MRDRAFCWDREPPEFDPSAAHIARVYNYWLGGKDHFAADRAAGDEAIRHTYSAYARGLDHVDLAYAILDLTALGRQEAWEEPRGRSPVIH